MMTNSNPYHPACGIEKDEPKEAAQAVRQAPSTTHNWLSLDCLVRWNIEVAIACRVCYGAGDPRSSEGARQHWSRT